MSEEMSMAMLFNMMKQELDKQAELITANTEKIMQTIDEKIKPLKEENKMLKLEVEELNKKIITLENTNRQNNILIHGLEETDTNYKELYRLVTQIFMKLSVKIENYDINKMYRIGKQKPGKTRPVLICFTTFNKKIEVLKNKKKMPENSYITDDFSKETLQQRKELQEQLKQEREKGHKVFIKHNKIVVKKQKENEKRKRDESTSPTAVPQNSNEINILTPAKLHRTDPFAYMRSRSSSLSEKTTSNKA